MKFLPAHLSFNQNSFQLQNSKWKAFSVTRDTRNLCRHVVHVWFPSANTQLGGPLVPHVFRNFSVQIVELVHCTPRTGSGLDKTFIHNTFRLQRFLATKADFGSSTTNWKECWKRKLYFFRVVLLFMLSPPSLAGKRRWIFNDGEGFRVEIFNLINNKSFALKVEHISVGCQEPVLMDSE